MVDGYRKFNSVFFLGFLFLLLIVVCQGEVSSGYAELTGTGTSEDPVRLNECSDFFAESFYNSESSTLVLEDSFLESDYIYLSVTRNLSCKEFPEKLKVNVDDSKGVRFMLNGNKIVTGSSFMFERVITNGDIVIEDGNFEVMGNKTYTELKDKGEINIEILNNSFDYVGRTRQISEEDPLLIKRSSERGIVNYNKNLINLDYSIVGDNLYEEFESYGVEGATFYDLFGNRVGPRKTDDSEDVLSFELEKDSSEVFIEEEFSGLFVEKLSTLFDFEN